MIVNRSDCPTSMICLLMQVKKNLRVGGWHTKWQEGVMTENNVLIWKVQSRNYILGWVLLRECEIRGRIVWSGFKSDINKGQWHFHTSVSPIPLFDQLRQCYNVVTVESYSIMVVCTKHYMMFLIWLYIRYHVLWL